MCPVKIDLCSRTVILKDEIDRSTCCVTPSTNKYPISKNFSKSTLVKYESFSIQHEGYRTRGINRYIRIKILAVWTALAIADADSWIGVVAVVV